MQNLLFEKILLLIPANLRGDYQSAVTAFDPSFVTGISVESFISTDGKAFSERVKDRLDKIIDASVKSHAQGDQQRDWHWTSSISKNSSTTLLPVCHAVFEYQGNTYNYWTDGTNTGRVVADSLPEDKQRKSVVLRGFLPSMAALASMPVAGYALGNGLMGGFTAVGFGALGTALGYGLIRRASIVGYSKRVRDAVLTQMQAESATTTDMTEEDRDKLVRSYSKPKKSIFANSAKDKVMLPVLSALAIVGGVVPNIKMTAAPSPVVAMSQPAELPMATPPAIPETKPVAEQPANPEPPPPPIVEQPPQVTVPPTQPTTEARSESVQQSSVLPSLVAKVIEEQTQGVSSKTATTAEQPQQATPVVQPSPSLPVTLTIDDQYKERVARKCDSGFGGLICQEKIKFKLCDGKWSDNPPAGQAVCKRVSQTNVN